MKTKETLLWILDKCDEKKPFDEEARKENITFVHSLGQKCDCVGWSKLDLSDKNADRILTEIDLFCKTNGWSARGWYERTYEEFESGRYVLTPEQLREDAIGDLTEYEGEGGEKISFFDIRAYRVSAPGPKSWGNCVIVPERFRDFCLRNNVEGVSFLWARDVGKYNAEQYFHLFCDNKIPCVAVGKSSYQNDINSIESLGGFLPRIDDIFQTIQNIDLQDCYIDEFLPDCGIANAFVPRSYYMNGRNAFLIRKELAEKIIKERVLPTSSLKPAFTAKGAPGGYIVKETHTAPRPTDEALRESLSGYEKLKAAKRPFRYITEKEALSALRKAKKDRRGEFNRPVSKTVDVDAAYSALSPYYLVADGGYLSNEYRLLPYDEAVKANAEFFSALDAEELLEKRPDGVVFALCPNGDNVLLLKSGKVVRFSHEAPEIVEERQSLPQFIVDALYE